MMQVIKRVAVFLVLSAVLLPAFSARPLRSVAGGAVAYTASIILGCCWSAPVGWSLTTHGDMAISVPAHDAWERGTVEIRTPLFIRNMPLFVAVVLAVASRRARHLLTLLGAGLFALVLLDGVVVAYTAWHTVAGSARPSGLIFELLALPSVYSSTGGMFVAPLFVGAFVARLLPTSVPRVSDGS